MELFYPEIRVSLGAYTFTEGIRAEVCSSRDSCPDWAKVSFTKQFKDKISLNAMDAAVISMGYGGDMRGVFSGFVYKSYNDAGGANEIELKDGMLPLMRTVINNTFLDTTPQEIIRYVLGQAGIERSELSASPSRRMARVPVYQKNGAAVINEVNTLFGAKHRFFFSDGVFYWGVNPGQDAVYTFTYAENIISLERMGGQWILETVSMPCVRHSHVISVEHPQVSGTFEVSKALFKTNDAGFIRTYLFF